MKISIHIVTWNSASVIEVLLKSIAQQTRKPDEIIIVDNASTDDTITKIKRSGLNIRLIEESTNTGFTGGHNTAFRVSGSDIMVVCNPDVILDSDTINNIEAAWQERPKAGIIIGEMRKDDQTTDSLGVAMHKGFRFYNIAEGEPRQKLQAHRVWGATGGFLTISRQTLNRIQDNGEYMDTRMVAYKDDTDLSWRINHAGLETWLDPAITVCHPRHAGRKATGFTWLSSLVSHWSHSKTVRFYSYRNHLWTIIKNATLREFFTHLPWFLWYELQKAGYLLITSPLTLLRAWTQTIHELPRLIRFRNNRP